MAPLTRQAARLAKTLRPILEEHPHASTPSPQAAETQPLLESPQALTPPLPEAASWNGSECSNKLQLKDFEIVQPLGEGGFGQVYLAKHKASGYICALKYLRKDNSQTQEKWMMVSREVEIHQRLRHPLILGSLAWFHDKKYVYIVLEYAAGGDLFSVVEKRVRLSEREVAWYVAQVAQAIEYLHKRKIMHRDIKLDNILIGLYGEVKLADFGLAAYARNGRLREVCGAAVYRPPEMIKQGGGGWYTNAVDMWALGILTFELLTGRSPFGDDEEIALQKIPRLETYPLPQDVSWDAIGFVYSLLRVDPAQRLSARKVLEHPWILKYARQPRSPDLPNPSSDEDDEMEIDGGEI